MKKLTATLALVALFLASLAVTPLVGAERKELVIVNTIESPAKPWGLTWDGQNLWAGLKIEGVWKVGKLDLDGNVLFSFDSPSSQPRDLAWGRERLWLADSLNSVIYEIDINGNVISSFRALRIEIPSGLTWDGEYFWISDVRFSSIYKFDASGNEIDFFDLDIKFNGLAWDGEHLWGAVSLENRIYEFDNSGSIIYSFELPTSNHMGLTWDGEHYWLADAVDYKFYELRVATYYSLSTSTSPSGGGSVVLNPSEGEYENGTEVTVTAVPAEGYMFQGWSGDIPSGHENDGSITILMNSDKSLTAHFSKVGGPEGGEEGFPLLWIGAGLAALAVVIMLILALKRFKT